MPSRLHLIALCLGFINSFTGGCEVDEDRVVRQQEVFWKPKYQIQHIYVFLYNFTLFNHRKSY